MWNEEDKKDQKKQILVEKEERAKGSEEGKAKSVPLHAKQSLRGRGSIAPTHYRPRN
jgi:hypothetical protein